MTIIGLILAVLGVVMIMLAALGLMRLPDVYMRSHAAGKAATFGVCCILLGSALGLGEIGALVRVLVAILFLFVTIPVGAQLIARAALRNEATPHPDTRVDLDLEPFLADPLTRVDPEVRGDG
jgi:multicomponent Na+:H+ antiporter subunit G